MIGLGLSLMGGALAQNDQGGAEAVYYPAQAAYCSRSEGLNTSAYNEDIHREWSDETYWFRGVALYASAPMWTPLVAGPLNIPINGGYVSGYYVQHNGASPNSSLYIYYRSPTVYYRSFPASQQSIKLECTLRNGQCTWAADGFTSRGTVTQSDVGDDNTRRVVAVYNNMRTFWGLSYQSIKGNVRVLYAPMTDGQGHSAIWSVFSQTLVEL